MKERLVIGLSHRARLIGPLGHRDVILRVDTGAISSSLDSKIAEDLGFVHTGRFKTIKSASGTTKRPVVTVILEIGGKKIEEEFSVIDRAHMKYVALLGQDILKKEKFIVDPLIERKVKNYTR